MSREQADLLFHVVAQRYQSRSMILTSNLTFGSSDTHLSPTTPCSPWRCSILSQQGAGLYPKFTLINYGGSRRCR